MSEFNFEKPKYNRPGRKSRDYIMLEEAFDRVAAEGLRLLAENSRLRLAEEELLAAARVLQTEMDLLREDNRRLHQENLERIADLPVANNKSSALPAADSSEENMSDEEAVDEFNLSQSVLSDLQADVDTDIEDRNKQFLELSARGMSEKKALQSIKIEYPIKKYVKNLMKLTFDTIYLTSHKLTAQGPKHPSIKKKVMPSSHYNLILATTLKAWSGLHGPSSFLRAAATREVRVGIREAFNSIRISGSPTL